MSLALELQLATTLPVPTEQQFQQWAAVALASCEGPIELCIRLVDAPESAALNSQYRGKSGPTNVLSFAIDTPVPEGPRLLGDLVLCAPVVMDEALQQHKAPMDHWAHLVVHGCLHLLGYDHLDDAQALEMENLEIELLAKLSIDNPYLERANLS